MRKRIQACVVFTFSLLALSPAAWAQDAPCRLQRVAALDLTYDRDNHPHIAVTLAGQTRDMIVDTGAIYGLVTQSAAKELGLKLGSLPVYGFRMFDGTQLTQSAVGTGFAIGRLPLPNYTFTVLPDSAGFEGDGLIGPDVLSVFDVDFDFGANKLNLFAPSACGDRSVYWADDFARLPLSFPDRSSIAHLPAGMVRTGPALDIRQIHTNAELDGTDIDVLIDTGSPYTIMTMEQAKYVFKWSSDQPGLVRINPDRKDAVPVYTYPFKTLTIGGVTVSNPRVLIRPVPGDGIRQTDVILGMGILRQLHVYISYRDKVMYVTPAKASR